VLDGAGGLDEINAGGGHDTLLGGSGDDILRGAADNDTLDGQGGAADLASRFYDSGAVTADLLSGTATDGFGNTDTLLRIENLSGAAGYNSTLLGNNSANVIDGWFGNHVLTGRGGADTLSGGEFSTDRFVYLATSDAPAGETIIDFDAGDLIDLSAIDTNAGLAGDQAYGFIGSAAFAINGTAQVRYSGTQVQADVHGDGVAEMFITLTGVVAMSAIDFVL
jgi:Ca2+-binding RTX toxin-like protein